MKCALSCTSRPLASYVNWGRGSVRPVDDTPAETMQPTEGNLFSGLGEASHLSSQSVHAQDEGPQSDGSTLQ
jgi:hypothetical protein